MKQQMKNKHQQAKFRLSKSKVLHIFNPNRNLDIFGLEINSKNLDATVLLISCLHGINKYENFSLAK